MKCIVMYACNVCMYVCMDGWMDVRMCAMYQCMYVCNVMLCNVM